MRSSNSIGKDSCDFMKDLGVEASMLLEKVGELFGNDCVLALPRDNPLNSLLASDLGLLLTLSGTILVTRAFGVCGTGNSLADFDGDAAFCFLTVGTATSSSSTDFRLRAFGGCSLVGARTLLSTR
jgi:hypothetical protein